MCVFVIQINKMRDEVAIAISTDNRNGCKDHSYTRAIRLNDIKLPTTNNKNDNRNAYHTIKLNADLLSLFFFLFTRIVAALDVVKEAKYHKRCCTNQHLFHAQFDIFIVEFSFTLLNL